MGGSSDQAFDVWIPAARAARHRVAGAFALVGFVWIAYLMLTGPRIDDPSGEPGARAVNCSSLMAGSAEGEESAQSACDRKRDGRLAWAILAAPAIALLGAVYVVGDVEPRNAPSTPA